MIRMTPSKSAAQAKDYFRDNLAKADYYLEGQEINGRFHGKVADRLGIVGPATQAWFFALCDNLHPILGNRLTPRTKKERTTGYDINFHAPKSVSIVHALSEDAHILEAFQQSVTETMQQIEESAMTRVRKGGKDFDRKTGELVWADFIHQTARPVEGHNPDMHLHAHCYVFNQTWDETEKRYKAGQFRQINTDMPYYEAMFHKRFSDKLIDLGYSVRRTAKSFEIEGVPQHVIKMFSKRTDEIGRVAKEKGITDAKELAELGAKTRAAKQKGLTMEELRADWRAQIRASEPQEITAGKEHDPPPIRTLGKAPVKNPAATEEMVQQCIDYALLHHFERASVVPQTKLLATAVKYGIGHIDVSLEEIATGMKNDSRILHILDKGTLVCTTKEVLAEEQRMVRLAQQGIGKLVPLYREAPDVNLKGQQAEAVKEVLTNTHLVSIIRGAAGAGKTTLMSEAVPLIERTGKEVTIVAPSARASRGVLQEEGFKQAETVAMLLVNKRMHAKLRDGVLWVDEAGLLGTRDMADLLQLATDYNAKVILGGDTKQHASVVRGDALRILNTVGGIKTAEVTKIYRQKNELYRSAVADIANGDVRTGFEKLNNLGSIKQINGGLQNSLLVKDYVAAIKAGKAALVVSPTHEQGEKVTEAIREELRAAKLIGKKEVEITKLTNINMTEAEKNDWRNISEGQVIQFSQNLPGIKRGSRWVVEKLAGKEITLKDSSGETLMLPEQKGKYFEVYKSAKIGLSKGDLVRVTREGFDQDKARLNNGHELEVLKVTAKGDILMQNPVSKARYTVRRDYGHLTHACCTTSYSSQGKTVDEAYIWQPASTFVATNAKQFYVSVSRAREKVAVYTDDKRELLEYASRLGDRQSAMELTAGKERHLEHIHHMERAKNAMEPVTMDKTRDMDNYNSRDNFSLNFDDYEPGF